MTADSTTTITGEKKTTSVPKQGTVTQRTSGSGSQGSSYSAPSTTTAASVKTGDDNVAVHALIVMAASIGLMARCIQYFRRKKAAN